MQRYRLDAMNDPRLPLMSCFLVDYPFAAQHARVADSKRVVYAGFTQALAGGVARDTERLA